ncbi:hypothetical protein ACE1CD_10140 [Aerosakkonema sp. BLCC-F183]|uniref:energy transducer TonB n=1 Tax=Aerosakkonema sp. BLCC-F183 TaxID=3342834 RepID=UPI0035B83BD3
MSYSSRVPTSSEKTFNLPTLLATLISLGAHGLLWVVGPALSSSNLAQSDPRTIVGFVQLTPDEMSRLPEYSLPQPKLPSLPAAPPKNLLPPLPPLQSYTPLPPPPSVPIYEPPTIPPSPPSVTSSERPSHKRSTSNREDAKLNERSSVSEPDIKIESRQTPQGTIAPDPTPTPESATIPRRSTTARRTATPSPTRTPESSITPQPSLSPKAAITPEVTLTPQPSISPETATTPQATPTPQPTNTPEGQNITKNTETGVRPNDTLPATVSPSVLPSPSSPPAIETLPKKGAESVAPNLQARLPNFYPKSAPTPPSQEYLDSVTKARYNYNPAGTTENEGREKYQKWWAEKVSRYTNKINGARSPKSLSIKSPYEEKVPDVAEGWVLVLFGPDGKIVGQPDLIRSTGYPEMNQKALEEVKKISIERTGKYEIYQYVISVEQNDLPSGGQETGRRD